MIGLIGLNLQTKGRGRKKAETYKSGIGDGATNYIETGDASVSEALAVTTTIVPADVAERSLSKINNRMLLLMLLLTRLLPTQATLPLLIVVIVVIIFIKKLFTIMWHNAVQEITTKVLFIVLI